MKSSLYEVLEKGGSIIASPLNKGRLRGIFVKPSPLLNALLIKKSSFQRKLESSGGGEKGFEDGLSP
jgi:predicted RNA-binding protein YlxR (DUF448 family)